MNHIYYVPVVEVRVNSHYSIPARVKVNVCNWIEIDDFKE